MSADNLMTQAASITAIGMLVVLIFLTVMVGIMKVLGKLVDAMEKYFPQAVPDAGDNALVAVAVAAARRFQGK